MTAVVMLFLGKELVFFVTEASAFFAIVSVCFLGDAELDLR